MSAPADYVQVRDRFQYLEHWSTAADRIVHVDEEHATSRGFWFAARTRDTVPGHRPIYWVYQPFGMTCEGGYSFIGFNPWLNYYTCISNRDTVEAASPGAGQRTDECVISTGSPWSLAYQHSANQEWGCSDGALEEVYSSLRMANPIIMDCAPWEIEAVGVSHCRKQTYPWMNDAAVEYWVPQADTCTGLPANYNYYRPLLSPEPYAARNVPDCKGQDLAVNCTDASRFHAACGGSVQQWPLVGVHDPHPSTETVSTSVTVSRSRTEKKVATVKQRVFRRTVTVTVHKRINGVHRHAVGTTRVFVTGSGSAAATATRIATATRTATRSCTLATRAEARLCAQEAASSAAREKAARAAAESARDSAAEQARQRARREATALAVRDARTSRISRSALDRARNVARAKALRRLRAEG